MKKEQLSTLTVKELKVMAKENGLKGYSKLRKTELVELLTTEVTFEEVCNKAPEEVHYWNGENECLSVYESLNKRNENIGFDPNGALVEKLNFLVRECNYILEEILCNGKNYSAPNHNTMSGEQYYEDKSAWLTKVNDTIAYKSYLLYLIGNFAAKTEAKKEAETKQDNIKVEGVAGTWYVVRKAVQDNGQPMLLLESEQYGEEVPCLIVDDKLNLIMTGAEGFDDYLNNSETIAKAQMFTKVYCNIISDAEYNEVYKKFFARIICSDVLTMDLGNNRKVTINNYNDIVNLYANGEIKTIYHPTLNNEMSLEEFLNSSKFKKLVK